MSNLSSERISEIRKRQKREMFLKYILLFVLILAPVSYLIYESSNENNSEEDLLGTSVENEIEVESPDIKVCLDSRLEDGLINSIKAEIKTVEIVSAISDKTTCDIQLMRRVSDNNDYVALHRSFYVLVQRVDGEPIDINSSDLRKGLRTGSITGNEIIWSDDSQKFINTIEASALLPTEGSDEDVLEKAVSKAGILAVIPLEESIPDLRIEKINGITPLQEEFYIYDYPLLDTIWISSNAKSSYPSVTQTVSNIVAKESSTTNFDKDDYSTVLLTGRSAFGARQFFPMTDSPLRELSFDLIKSDLLFISNESSFTDDCIQQDNSNYLCGKIKHFDWLRESGADVVSVVGESIIDQGREAFTETLALYDAANIAISGGGINRDEALKVNRVKVGAKEMSFISVSLITPTRYLATERLSGNIAADRNLRDAQNLEKLLNSTDRNSLRVVEFRWNSQSDGGLTDLQKYYINKAVDLGADVVIGTAEDEIGRIYHSDGTVIATSLGKFLYSEDKTAEDHGMIMKLHLFKGRFISYELMPLTMDESYILRFSDMDTAMKMMNTVYVDTFVQF